MSGIKNDAFELSEEANKVRNKIKYFHKHKTFYFKNKFVFCNCTIEYRVQSFNLKEINYQSQLIKQ